MTTKTWFITGTSRGFGRIWAQAALERGDRVAATARDVRTLGELAQRFGTQVLPLELDVRDRAAAFAAVREAHDHFGGLDIVVNNAGYGLFGTIEEVSEQQARDQIETNVFGALWVTQAAIPYLRQQGSGHILQVSSIGGVSAFPNLGLYNASKWALEGFSQALAAELAPFGVSVTLIEPTAYGTDWGGPSAVHADPLPPYEPLREARRSRPMVAGDPQATADAILAVVDADEPPLRLFLGSSPLQVATADYERRLAEWSAWQEVAARAQGD